MLEATEPVHPNHLFFAARYITLGEPSWLQGKDVEAAAAPCVRTHRDCPPPFLGDTLLRFGLGQPSLIQAWAARTKAKPRAAGESEAAEHFFEMGSDSEGSDWE